MKKIYSTLKGLNFLMSAATLYSLKTMAQTVIAFPYTGTVQTFTVPSCVTNVTINARGAQGTAGSSPAGSGGVARGVLSVTQGQVLYIYVGGQAGFNGGGAAGSVPQGGSGGGASDVRVAPGSLADRVIVA